MRTLYPSLLLGLALISSTAWCAARQAMPAPPSAPAAAATDVAASDAAIVLPGVLKPGMGYRPFAQTLLDQGWQVVDPIAADSCMAAGDCEIEFLPPTPGPRLRVQIGSQAGAAVVQGWRARQVQADRLGGSTASNATSTSTSTPVTTAQQSR
ncbi:hypothetical protein [Xanthomonas maliensis]|uniref:hypothetical protein n=1 Tax=Xanthomonas maliensis TaxID=1321368 RepID=UPI0003A03A76|nr:hypothetical protein [Xanthomonas maliensis]KAB7764585.1 hypothetical protein CKY51_17110 [Xanthomonas maliensis]